MDKYASVDCPICGKPLSNGENIVVCPTCGAPYHRSCFSEKKQCIFTELHEKGEEWQSPKSEEKFDGNAQLRCSRCGTINPKDGLFCQVCGNQLNDNLKDTGTGPQQNTPPPFGMGGGFTPPGIPLNPFTTPFGGVAPDEVIDEVPAKDLAVFVGRNSHYYLPKFKDIANKKNKIINWAAFFFQGGYFIYRKMYGIGILVFLISFFLSIPNVFVVYQSVTSTVNLSYNLPIDLETLKTLNVVSNFLVLGLRFVCGLFANSLYKHHSYKIIKAEKSKNLPEDEYLAVLGKKGSVAIKLITGLLIGYMVINIAFMYMILLMGI